MKGYLNQSPGKRKEISSRNFIPLALLHVTYMQELGASIPFGFHSLRPLMCLWSFRE